MERAFTFRLKWAIAAAGGLAAVVGVVVMAGWMLRLQAVVQIAPGLAAMQFNTALGFVLCGAGLVAAALRRPRVAAGCGALVAAMALAVLSEYAFRFDLGIDALFLRPFLADSFSPPGRMSPGTAVAFTFSGAALIAGIAGPRRMGTPLAGGLASAVTALGAFALIGYVSGLIGVEGFSHLQGMAVHTAMGFLLVGLGLFALAWNRERARRRRVPSWLPVPVGVACVTLTVALWLALVARDQALFDQGLRETALVLGRRIEERIGARLLALVRMAQRWNMRGGTPREEWERDALLYSLHQPGLLGLAWVDGWGRVRWGSPEDTMAEMLGAGLALDKVGEEVLEAARGRGGLTVTRRLAQGWADGNIGALTPLNRNGTFDGFLLAILDVGRLLAPILEEPEMVNYRLAVSDGNEVVYGNARATGPPPGLPVAAQLIRIHDQIGWQLRIWPTRAFVAESLSALPWVTLVVGLIFSVLLTGSTQLGLHAWRMRAHVEAVNRSLQAEVDERERAEEAVKKSNTALEAINGELEAFSYSVSHDLRQPLRGMSGFGEILLEDYGDKLDDLGRDYLRRIQAASERMGRLIDDLLALSRITRGELRHEPVDLSAQAEAVLAELRQGEPDRVVKTHVEAGLDAKADARMVRILLTNLLSNAWKFSGKTEHARIEMGHSESGNGGGNAFYVRDNGAGFDMAYADKLFGAFQRLHSVEEFPGTGVGLATVQRIAHRHGGRVWAEGEKGRGATIYFTLG